MFQSLIKALFLLSAMLLLQGCTTAELAIDLFKKQQRNSAQNGAKPHYKVGNPYQVAGIWYYPKRDLTYDETGLASWYGEETAKLGRPTANGEAFDPKLASAAHRTLPLPSVVRVTNLDNGKSLVVRVNDRGPFVAGRIIDLSYEGARLLGFVDNGLAKVRVQILAEQSLRLENLAKRGQFPDLSSSDPDNLPEMNAAATPKVNMVAKSSKIKARVSSGETQSALDLLSQSQVGEVISVAPVSTRIWVQVGAFHSEIQATSFLLKFNNVGRGKVHKITRQGKTLYRARLGPINDVAVADKMLDEVFKIGYPGARIIVD